MPNRRHPFRRLTRSRVRGIVRPPFRQRWRSRDDLAEAMTCFRRAIRAHRRLNKLAPHEFDAAVVERDCRDREARRARLAMIDPLLEKVYGPPTEEERERRQREELSLHQPPPLPPNTRQAVEREYAAWQFWMEAGWLAKARHQQRRPHAVPSLGRVVRLVAIAFDFGRLATGLDHGRPAAPELPPRDFEADLLRAHGSPSNAQHEVKGSAVCPAWPTSLVDQPDAEHGSSNSMPVENNVPVVPQCHHPFPQSPRPEPSPPRRRDAWQSWARYQRRSAA